ncbi:MAG: hypothetical protein AAGP08_04275 [Pseudomonadota bacterium]
MPFDDARVPARLTLDPAGQRAWIEAVIDVGQSSWAVFDWSDTNPMAYFGKPEGCQRLKIEGSFAEDAMLLMAGDGAEQTELDVAFADIPIGLSVSGNTALIRWEDILLRFEASETRTARENTSPPIGADVCETTLDLDALVASRQETQEDTEDTSVAVQMNRKYSFHGLGYWWIGYQDRAHRMSLPEYSSSRAQCVRDGRDKCRPTYEFNINFGRYGYHCGGGWGGSSKVLSPMDRCCNLHDLQKWNGGGSPGKEARNLCGFLACQVCRREREWRGGAPDDIYAIDQISRQTGLAAVALYCFPHSNLTGFTCD